MRRTLSSGGVWAVIAGAVLSGGCAQRGGEPSLPVAAAVQQVAPLALSETAPAPWSVAEVSDGAGRLSTDKIRLPGSTVEFAMVRIPGGRIKMTGEDGRTTVHEIKPIWMGRTEVRWDEYDVFWMLLDVPERDRWQEYAKAQRDQSRPSRPYSPPDRGWGHEGSPAGSMQYLCAKAYCAWLSKNTGHTYRLPTEAEWEYACRAGGGPVRMNAKELGRYAWSADNSDEQTHPVAQKAPNAWGLYDMLGNVAEWVTRADGTSAVAGGSFQDEATDVTSGQREEHNAAWHKRDPNIPPALWLSDGGHVGFRIVRED